MDLDDMRLQRRLEAVQKDYSVSGRLEEQARLPAEMVEVFQLKVTLEGSEPPIWRRLQLAASTTLDDVHDVLQIAMGWENDHLHCFMVGSQSLRNDVYFSDPTCFHDGDVLDELRARLDAVLLKPKRRIRYTYDLGDCWRHSVVLERILVLSEREAAMPRCVAGKRACPAEDAGGIPGWEALLSILADPAHPDHAHFSEVLGPDLDPEAFDLEAINTALTKRFAPKPKRRQTRSQP